MSSSVEPVLSKDKCILTADKAVDLAQGHNAVTPVRLKPVAPRSQVKHSTTELMRSLGLDQKLWETLNFG